MDYDILMNKINAIDENAYLVTIEGGEYVDISECKYENIDAIENMLRDYFEDGGENIETVYADSYFTCECCGKNKWMDNGYYKYIRVVNETAVCVECLEKAEHDNVELAEAYFDELLNDYRRANEFLSNEFLEAKGFELQNVEHSVGWYSHNDNVRPERIFNIERENGNDIVFQLTSRGPWEQEYTFWTRPTEAKR